MNDKGTILIVDDQRAIRLFVSAELEKAGYTTLTASSGLEAMDKLQDEQEIDVILLDLRMPEMNGLQVMDNLKHHTSPPAVILLTAHCDFNAAVEMIRLQGHDYLLKPCKTKELLSSIEQAMTKRKETLRREQMANVLEETVEKLNQISSTPAPSLEETPTSQHQTLKIRGLLLNSQEREATHFGEPLHLTPSEFKILWVLMRHADQAISYQELAAVLHGLGNEPKNIRRALNTHLWRLRHKINQRGNGTPYIENVHGYGYQFIKKTPASKNEGKRPQEETKENPALPCPSSQSSLPTHSISPSSNDKTM